MMTEVVNKKSSSFDVYIGRGSKWGNPFTMNSESTRDVVTKLLKEYGLEK